MKRYLLQVYEVLPVIAIAMFGGLVRFIAFVEQRRTFRRLIAELVVSAFAGMMFFYVCKHFGVSGPLMAAGAGIAGLSSTEMLNIFKKRFLERIAADRKEK